MNPPLQPDPELSAALRAWTVDSKLSPNFASGVRHRISQSRTVASSASLASLLHDWVVSTFLQPRFALATAMVLVLAGGGAGYWQGRLQGDQAEHDLRVRYLQVVNPLQLGHSG